MRLRSIVTVVLGAFAMLPALYSQSVTGQIVGTVLDASGGAVPGAAVRLTSDLSGQERTFLTEASGSFTFTNLVPGNYSVHIGMPGFKTYDQKAINVSAQERVDLHSISLQVGDVSNTVTVEAQAARVATDSSDHSTDVNLKQIEETPIRGRSFQAIIKALPGVIDTNNYDTRGWGSGSPKSTAAARAGAGHVRRHRRSGQRRARPKYLPGALGRRHRRSQVAHR